MPGRTRPTFGHIHAYILILIPIMDAWERCANMARVDLIRAYRFADSLDVEGKAAQDHVRNRAMSRFKLAKILQILCGDASQWASGLARGPDDVA